jgi:hypothetical protein
LDERSAPVDYSAEGIEDQCLHGILRPCDPALRRPRFPLTSQVAFESWRCSGPPTILKAVLSGAVTAINDSRGT